MRKSNFTNPKLRNFVAIMLVSFFTIVLLSSAIFAQSSPTNLAVQVPFQGKLSDSAGKALTGNYDLKFEISDASAAKWSEEQKGVSVSKGRFQVYLGKNNALTDSLAVDGLLYVQVSVKLPAETSYKTLNPKIVLSPTFAKVYKAKNAEAADSAGTVPAAGVQGSLADGNIPSLAASKINSGVFAIDRLPVAKGIVTALTGSPQNPISFGKTLSNPVVVCSTKTINIFCRIATISSNDFTPYVYNSAGNAATSDIYWIAIGS